MSKRFAILIGIDDYSSIQVRSLEGAVNDVNDVESWLKKHSLLKWKKITRLTTNGRDQRPTYANILCELEKVKKASAPGDFIFIQYSGHGSWRDSRLRCRKKKHVVDEILLFEKGYMRDFEFGAILDDLAEKRTVFLLLDCCFSAGQDRDEGDPEDEIGCRVTTQNLTTLEEHDIDPDLLKRVNNASESWWDRPRNYTLLAACGRTQTAREANGKKGHRNGILTDFTLEALKNIYTKAGPFTYQALLRLVRISIDRRLEEENKGRRQDPELFGQCNRLLFRSDTIAPETFAFIVRNRNRKVQLDAGEAHGVTVGARYRIHCQKFDAKSGLEEQALGTVTVSEVGGLFSLANIPKNLKPDRIRDGYLAIPEPPVPCHTASIFIQHADSGRSTPPLSLQRLEEVFQSPVCHCQNACTCLQQQETPLNESSPAFRILLRKGRYHIHDGRSGEDFPHIKSLEASQTGVEETLHELVHALEGVWRFKKLSNSQSKIDDWFSFGRVDKNPSVDVRHGETFTYLFKNLSNQDLYFSLLNLLPSGEIQQLRPRQGVGLEPIARGEEIQKDIEVTMPPEMPGIKRAPETYKVIVATQQSSFGLYQTQRFLEKDVCEEYRLEVNRGQEIGNDDDFTHMDPGNWQARDIAINVVASRKRPS